MNICKIKEPFVHFFVYVLCTVFVNYFIPFLSEKFSFPVEIKCLGKKLTIFYTSRCLLRPIIVI